MVNVPLNTEQKILEAAKIVFHRKGFDGARMQEIADEAGINKSLLHYYYRSKENLFNAVFKAAFLDLFKRLTTVISSGSPLEEKVKYFFSDYISFLQKNSYIPWFILNTIHQNPEKIAQLFRETGFSPDQIFDGIKKSVRKEGIKVRDSRQLVINIISLSIFPLLARPLLMIILGLKEKEFDKFIETRKKELPEFFMNAIHRK
jgi:TetR/AcrR family transcriptional regulator